VTYDIGRAIWWPSKLWRRGVESEAPAVEADTVPSAAVESVAVPSAAPELVADDGHPLTREEYRRTLES
jgi:RND superfamily putative drug exporter